MSLTRIALALTFLCTAVAARSETVSLDAFGLQVAPVQDGFSRVLAVQEFGPAWQADLAAGDVIRNDVRGLVNDDARAATMVGNGATRRMILYLVDDPDASNLLTVQTTQVRLEVVAFEGGPWLVDGVRLSDRKASKDDATALVERSDRFVEDTLARIQALPCSSENKLTREDHAQARVWAHEADGYAKAAGIAPPPGRSILSAVSNRDIECRRAALFAAAEDRLEKFEASVGSTAHDLVDLTEFGVRLRPTELAMPNGTSAPALQIHSIEEGGPFWQATAIRPGDLILGNTFQLERQITRDRERWSRLQEGEPRVLNLQIYVLDEPLLPGDAPLHRIVVFDYASTGIWYGDRLSAHSRAALTAGTEELATFQDTLERYFDELEAAGCTSTYPRRNAMVRDLDRLYLLAGLYPPSGLYGADIHRRARVACENETLGPLKEADLVRLAKIRSAPNYGCNNEGAITASLDEFARDVTRNNYSSVAEYSIRELLQNATLETRTCVVEDMMKELFTQE